jgi:sugar O-acyltransferase (sialic acid O-acetyltransferase NeuD family)
MRERIVLIGGGGHCKACIEVIESEGRFEIAGIVDMRDKRGMRISGYEIIGTDEDLAALAGTYRNFLITVGQVKSADKRYSLFTALKELAVQLPRVISPSARVSKHAEIGEGTIIMHGATIGPGVRIGRNCIINTGAIVEHDSVIDDHCHISTGSIINGECRLGEGVLLGSGSVISNAIGIANNVVVGAGSVVIRHIEESGTYVGGPARKIK